MITFSSIRTFLTVAELGEIRAASIRLGRTPSAVSMSLKQLEEAIGVKLFEGDRKNKLTATGAFAARHFGGVLRHYDRVEETMRDFVRNTAGRVDIASVPSVAAHLLPKVISRYRLLAPTVSIGLRDMDSRSVVEAVERGEVGIGIASSSLPQHSLAFSLLFSEPLGVVCRADHPLAQAAQPVSLEALKEWPLVTNNFTGMMSVQKPEEPKPQLAAFTVMSALGLVRAGICIAVLSRLSVPDWDRELVFLRLGDDNAVRHVGVLTRSEAAISPAEALFIDLLRDTVSSSEMQS